MKMFKLFMVAAALLLVSATSFAQVPTSATGFWKSNAVYGFEFSLAVGKYYVNQYGFPTCGMTIRLDAAVPLPNESVHGRAYLFKSSGEPINYNLPMVLRRVTRPGLLGFVTINSYNPSTDTLTVTTNLYNGGPSGTYTMYRDVLAPFITAVPPC